MLHLVVVIDNGSRLEMQGDIDLQNALNVAASWGQSLNATRTAQTQIDRLTARAQDSLARLKAALVADSTTT